MTPCGRVQAYDHEAPTAATVAKLPLGGVSGMRDPLKARLTEVSQPALSLLARPCPELDNDRAHPPWRSIDAQTSKQQVGGSSPSGQATTHAAAVPAITLLMWPKRLAWPQISCDASVGRAAAFVLACRASQSRAMRRASARTMGTSTSAAKPAPGS
jgi:hypothetical protein